MNKTNGTCCEGCPISPQNHVFFSDEVGTPAKERTCAAINGSTPDNCPYSPHTPEAIQKAVSC